MELSVLKKISEELPRGAKTEIAKKAKVSKVTVSNFFAGLNCNSKVLAATKMVYGEYKNGVKALNDLAEV